MINGNYIKLNNIYYSPNINKNLISGIRLAKEGYFCEIKNKRGNTILCLKVKENNKVKFFGSFPANDVNVIRLPIVKTNSFINYINNDETTNLDERSKLLWHRRLGHYYYNDLNKYLELHNIKDSECLDCKVSKLKRKPHTGKSPSASNILEIIHSDLIGPIRKSITGKKYILTFIDEFSRKAWIYVFHDKAEVPKTIIQFLKYIKNHFQYNIKYFKTDNDKEYKNKKVENYCKNNGIMKIYSPQYNPQNNGKAERFNYTIIDYAKTVLN